MKPRMRSTTTTAGRRAEARRRRRSRARLHAQSRPAVPRRGLRLPRRAHARPRRRRASSSGDQRSGSAGCGARQARSRPRRRPACPPATGPKSNAVALAALLALARPLGLGRRRVDRAVVAEHDAVRRRAPSRARRARRPRRAPPPRPAGRAGPSSRRRPPCGRSSMSPGCTSTSSHLAGSTCSVPSARRRSLVERSPGSPPSTPHGRVSQRSSWIETWPGSRYT